MITANLLEKLNAAFDADFKNAKKNQGGFDGPPDGKYQFQLLGIDTHEADFTYWTKDNVGGAPDGKVPGVQITFRLQVLGPANENSPSFSEEWRNREFTDNTIDAFAPSSTVPAHPASDKTNKTLEALNNRVFTKLCHILNAEEEEVRNHGLMGALSLANDLIEGGSVIVEGSVKRTTSKSGYERAAVYFDGSVS